MQAPTVPIRRLGALLAVVAVSAAALFALSTQGVRAEQDTGPPAVQSGSAKSNCLRILEAGYAPRDYVLVFGSWWFWPAWNGSEGARMSSVWGSVAECRQLPDPDEQANVAGRRSAAARGRLTCRICCARDIGRRRDDGRDHFERRLPVRRRPAAADHPRAAAGPHRASLGQRPKIRPVDDDDLPTPQYISVRDSANGHRHGRDHHERLDPPKHRATVARSRRPKLASLAPIPSPCASRPPVGPGRGGRRVGAPTLITLALERSWVVLDEASWNTGESQSTRGCPGAELKRAVRGAVRRCGT